MRYDWLPLVWSGLILLMVVQHWWASFGLAGREEWRFADFLVTLLVTALIYMMAAIVLPDVPADKPTDLREHFARERKALFGLFAISILGSVGREWQLEGRLPEPENLLFHGLFLGVAVTGLLTGRRRVHEGIAVLLALLFGSYVVLLFTRLGS